MTKRRWLRTKLYYPEGTTQVFCVVFLFRYIPIWMGWQNQIIGR